MSEGIDEGMALKIVTLGDSVAQCEFIATIGHAGGSTYPASFMRELNGEYIFMIDGKLEAIEKGDIDSYYEAMLDQATSGDIPFDPDDSPRITSEDVYDDGETILVIDDSETSGVFTADDLADADAEFTHLNPLAMSESEPDTVYDGHQESEDEAIAAAQLQSEAEASFGLKANRRELIALNDGNDAANLAAQIVRATTGQSLTQTNIAVSSEGVEVEIQTTQTAPATLVLTGLPDEKPIAVKPINPDSKGVNMAQDTTTHTEDADVDTRLRAITEEMRDIRDTFGSPEAMDAVSRVIEALHDSVLHESQKTVDHMRRTLEVMAKVYIETPCGFKDGVPIYSKIRIMDRDVRPEDIADLPRHRLFDVMHILGTEFARLRSSYFRLDRQHDSDNERIKGMSDEIEKLRKQLGQRDTEIKHLRENREGLTEHEAQSLVDLVHETERRNKALTARMAQMSDPEDAFVLYMPIAEGRGVFLSFDKSAKMVNFHTSISTTGNEADKMLMTRNEIQGALPRLWDWLDRSILSPQAKEHGLRKQDKITIIPMQVMYRNSKPIVLSLSDGKAKVEVAKEIGASPMPIRDLAQYMEAPLMAGKTLADFKSSRKQREDLEKAVEAQKTGGVTFTPSATPVEDVTETDEDVEDFSQEAATPRSSILRRGRGVTPTRPVAKQVAETEAEAETGFESEEAETEEETAPVVNTPRSKSSVMARLSAKMAGLRQSRDAQLRKAKAADEVEAEEAAEETEAEETPAKASRRAPVAPRKPVATKAPARTVKPVKEIAKATKAKRR